MLAVWDDYGEGVLKTLEEEDEDCYVTEEGEIIPKNAEEQAAEAKRMPNALEEVSIEEGMEEMAEITSSRVTVRHSVAEKVGSSSLKLGSGCFERRAAMVSGVGGMKVSLEVRSRRAARMSPSAHLERTRPAIFSADPMG